MMLYSTIMKLTDEYLERVRAYCEEHEMPITIRSRSDPKLPYYVLVWGTKAQLKEFNEHF